MHIAIWVVVVLSLALWSLLAWGVSTLLGLDPAWVGDLRPLLGKMPFSDVLDTWVPGWQALALTLIDAAQALLGWLGSGAAFVVWLVWGAGAVLVLGTGAVLSWIVKLVDKTPAPASAAADAAPDAATSPR